MQLPYFFQETLRAFSIKCISMLFHNTIYFIYNKQRDLEQTNPSPNAQHRKWRNKCRSSEANGNRRQNTYKANKTEQRENYDSFEQRASNRKGRNYRLSSILTVFLKLRCLHTGTFLFCYYFNLNPYYQNEPFTWTVRKPLYICQDSELLNQTISLDL